ncbi:MAG TPA: hypothetical protein VGK35_07975 [Actinotalea sp.]
MSATVSTTGPAVGSAPPRSAATTVRGLISAELLKLTTTRSARWIVLSAAALAALAISGVVASGGVRADALPTEAGLRTVLLHGGMSTILPLILGILVSAGEYRHGTVVDTFLTEPRRGLVVAAKAAAGAVVGLLLGLLVAVTTALTASLWYAAKDVELDLSSTLAVRSLAGIVAWSVLYTVLGVAVGSLIRSPAAAIVSVVVWLTVVETAVAGLLVEVGRWLPATAASTLGGSPLDGLLPQAGAGGVLLGWTALAAGAAVLVTARRDVG